MAATNPTTPRVRLKPIALPAEHGSWGFLLEPILLGLAVAASLGGFLLALAVSSAFLLRNPLRIFLRGRRRPVTHRVVVARRVAVIYGAVAVISGASAVVLAGVKPLWPLALVGPLAAAYVLYDSRNRGRTLSAEFVGPVALAASAPAIALSHGWSEAAAVSLWVVLVIKALPTVIYVRARLRLEDGQPSRPLPSLAGHAIAVAVAAFMARSGACPWTTAAVLIVLAARAAIGLSPRRVFHTPKQIGISEFVYSGIYVVATAVGYRGWV